MEKKTKTMLGISIHKEVEKAIIKVAKKEAQNNNINITDIRYYLSIATDEEGKYIVKVFPYISGKRQGYKTVKEFLGGSIFLNRIENKIIEIATEKANTEKVKITMVGHFLQFSKNEGNSIAITPYVNKKYQKTQTIKEFLK